MEKTLLIFVIVLGLGVFNIPAVSYAAWDGSAYDPNETLDPECSPGDASCTVSFGITSSGTNVSVGTTTPVGGAVLTVEATSTSAIATVIRGFASQVADLFRIISNTGTQLFTFTANGWLGIGTSTPSAVLAVGGDAVIDGDVNVTGTTTQINLTTTNATSTNFAITGTLDVSGASTLAGATTTSLYTTTLGVGSEYFTDLTGSGLSLVSGALTVSTSTLIVASSTYATTAGTSTGALSLNGFDQNNYLSLSAWNATTTDALDEGSANLYFTDARARSALSSNALGLSYSTTTGQFSLTSGYNIPLTASTTEWVAAYASTTGDYYVLNTGDTISGDLTVTGTSTLTTLGINSEYFTDLTGSGLSLVSGTLTVSTSTLANDFLLRSNNLSDLTSSSTARTNLGVDLAGTDNSTNVTLAGSYDYLTLSGQQITLNQLDLTTDVTSTLPVANGGTGATTFTANTLLVGNGTGAITSTTTAGLKATLALNNVENTALSTWAGSTNLTTLGTITSGVWQGSVIADTYINDALTISAGTINNTLIGASTPSTAVFTNATSTNFYATTLGINSEYFTDLTGVGLTLTNGALTVATSTFNLDPSTIDLTQGYLLVGDPSGNAQATSTLYVTSAGNVGIGTTSPTTKLHVAEDTAGTAAYLRVHHSDGTNSASDAVLQLRTEEAAGGDPFIRWTVGNQPSTGEWSMGIDNNSTDAFRISNGTNLQTNRRFTIDYQGNVGIGTASPNDALEVLSTSDAQLRLAYDTSNYQALQVLSDGGTTWSALGTDADLNFDFTGATDGDFSVNTNALFVDTSSGNVGIGTTTPARALTVVGSGAGIRIDTSGASNSGLEIYQNGAYKWAMYNQSGGDDLLFYDGTADRVTFANGGNVGIGTTDPSVALDVSGSASLTGSLFQPVYGSDDGLVMYLPLSETGTTHYDRSPYAHDGTVSGGATCNATNGKYGNGCYFDGVNGTIETGAVTELQGDSSWTASLWAKCDANASSEAALSIRNGTDSTNLFVLYPCDTFAGNGVRVFYNSASIIDENGVDRSGAWHLFTFVSASSTDHSVYVDGNLIATSTTAKTLSSTITNVNVGTYVTQNFQGNIDEVMLYNRALSEDEVRTHYLRGRDSSSLVLSDSFKVMDTNGDINLLVGSDGNVGIGTTSPSEKLTLAGGNFLQIASGTPTLAGSYTSGISNAYDVSVSGNYAYVVSNLGTLNIFDITDPTSPTLEGSYTAAAQTYSVAVSGKYAYIAVYTSGLEIVDVSDPESPTQVGLLDTAGANYVYVSGKYAYVADDAFGLQIIDVSDPTSPTLAGSYDTSGTALGVYVSGKYAYVADRTSGLQIIDVSDPSTPTLSGTYNTPDLAYDVVVSGKYAYVADRDTLQIIDVSSSTAPTLAGSYDTTDNIFGVSVAGDYTYLASGGGGAYVIDVSSPTTPSLVGNYGTFTAYDIDVSGKYAYLSASDGFYIVDINGIKTPALAAGSVEAGILHVTGDLEVGNNIFAQGGLSVGLSGINSRGPISAYVEDAGVPAATFMGGNVGIGTTTPNRKLTLSGQMQIDASGADDPFIEFTNQGAVGGYVFYDTSDNVVTMRHNTGGNSQLSLGSTGNVGIGTSTPSANLVINGTTGQNLFQIATSTNQNILTVNQSGSVQFGSYGAGTLTTDASGNITVSSDERLKDIQGSFDKGLEAIRGLTPANYKWNELSGLDVTSTYSGFIAQNVQEFIPEAVGEDLRGYLTLSDRPILAATVNAVQELDMRTTYENGGTEVYETKDDTIEVGELVVIDSEHVGFVARATSTDVRVLGVVATSTPPGFFKSIFSDEHQVAVVHTGRVQAKVATSSAIAVGDTLALSTTTPGALTKATSTAEYTIGFALQGFEPETSTSTTIAMLVSSERQLSLAKLSEMLATNIETSTTTPSWVESVIAKVFEKLADFGVAIKDGVATFASVVSDKLTTRELCVGDTCVTEAEFKALVEGQIAATAASGGSTNTTVSATLIINGNNPVYRDIGESWKDTLGAIFTRGGASETIYSTSTVDTTLSGTTTIDYWASYRTDPADPATETWLHATRDVVVSGGGMESEAITTGVATSTPEVVVVEETVAPQNVPEEINAPATPAEEAESSIPAEAVTEEDPAPETSAETAGPETLQDAPIGAVTE